VPVPFGETAVIDVAEFTVKLLALAEPNLTAVAPVKPVPVMVTLVPPLGGPRLGSTLLTVGAYTNCSRPGGLVAPAAVTVTSTLPAPAGVTAVMEVAEFTVKLAALFDPN
jgi:hypothetical protein